MTTISPWINFNGNAEEAFTLYQTVFGGEFTKVVRFKDLASAEFLVPEAEANKVMYIALPINGANVLVGNDVPTFMGTVNERENRSKIYVTVDSNEEVDRIMMALAEGGEVEGPAGHSPWGTYCGMLRDKYGIEWVVECQSNS